MHDSVLCRENREGPKQLRMIQRVVAAAVELHGPVSPCRIIAREIRLCYLIQRGGLCVSRESDDDVRAGVANNIEAAAQLLRQ